MHRVRELGIFEAEEIRGFLLRRFRSPTGTTFGVLRTKSERAWVLRAPRLKYSGSPRLRKFGLSLRVLFLGCLRLRGTGVTLGI